MLPPLEIITRVIKRVTKLKKKKLFQYCAGLVFTNFNNFGIAF